MSCTNCLWLFVVGCSCCNRAHPDEGYATGASEAELRRGNTGTQASSAAALQAPPTTNNSIRHPLATGHPFLRHNYGAPCVGADIRSLGRGDEDAVVAFLRPCQTLEACQKVRSVGVLRRRSIPEAEVVRAALHMLQGLAGDIFVRAGEVGDCGGRRGRGESNTGREGRTTGGVGRASSIIFRSRFVLSASAVSDLAVASLSPAALAGALEEFVRIGSVADYLRAFVADAEASTSVAAANHRTVGTLTLYPNAPAASAGCENISECKHGHATQAFAMCVRRQLEAFEDVVAGRDRWLYRRQRGLDDGQHAAAAESTTSRKRSSERRSRDGASASGETILGLLSLLRREGECLELTRQLVEAGAGWWVETLPGEGTRPGKSAGGLRERTGRLLATLHDSLVADALVRPPPVEGVSFRLDAGALAPRRGGWLLHVFCEVLAPYLRLVDAWITEGRILDPHGELFFSQSGGGGTAGVAAGVERYGSLPAKM